MKPTYEELQEQLENALREFRSADITMQNLEAKCEKLAAENVGLKVGRKFFMYSDDSGFETYKTQEEAINAAQEMIDVSREDAYDGWPEEADTIRWGVVIQQATETDFEKPAPGNGWVGSSDYKLLPETQETPATDAFLAEVRSSAIDSIVDIKTKQLADMHPDTHAFGATAMSIRSQINELQSFAAQIRKGVQS